MCNSCCGDGKACPTGNTNAIDTGWGATHALSRFEEQPAVETLIYLLIEELLPFLTCVVVARWKGLVEEHRDVLARTHSLVGERW